MNEDKFKKIDDINETLKNVNETARKNLQNLNGKKQEYVDMVCTNISEKCNGVLAEKREDLIKFLHEGYSSSMEVISGLEPLVTLNPVDLGSVISSVKKIIEIMTGPYYQAIEFNMTLMPKLQDLMTNIALLAMLPMELPMLLDTNYDKLKVKMQPITMINIITGDPNAKEVPPEPEEPGKPPFKRQFTFNSYQELLAYPVDELKDGDASKVIYSISDEAKEKLKFSRNIGSNYVIETYIYNKKLVGKNKWVNKQGDIFKTTDDIKKWINEKNIGPRAASSVYEVGTPGNFVFCTSVAQNLDNDMIWDPHFIDFKVNNGNLKPEDYIYVDRNGIPVTY